MSYFMTCDGYMGKQIVTIRKSLKDYLVLGSEIDRLGSLDIFVARMKGILVCEDYKRDNGKI